jgi:hypothetical protein
MYEDSVKKLIKYYFLKGGRRKFGKREYNTGYKLVQNTLHAYMEFSTKPSCAINKSYFFKNI